MSIQTDSEPTTWDDGTPRSTGNVFCWRSISWDGPIAPQKRRKKRVRVAVKQRSHRDRVLQALRNLT